MQPKTTTLELSKSTAGTHVYMEPSDKARADKVFPTIYVQKHALPDPPPTHITVTIQDTADRPRD
jgi:hypothetical protein